MVDAGPQVLPAILESLNAQVLNELSLAASIGHPGESGRAREQIITRFLRRLLPDGYGISTGFVIDAVGGISRQVDLVIYRTGYHPVLEIGGVNHFLVESVVAVIENKAAVDSVADLVGALANIASVKSLDRTNRAKNYALPLTGGRPSVDREDFQHQVFGVIVTEASLSQKALVQELLRFLRSAPQRSWPNLYVDVHRFVLGYNEPHEVPQSFGAVPGDHIALVGAETGRAPLIDLAFELCNYLRVAPLIDYSAVDYLAPCAEARDVKWWRVAESG
jgi:hypothetical protein